MTKLSFNDITPVNPFKNLADITSSASDYFFKQAQALQEAKQQELVNRLAQQRLAEDKRINDSTIAVRNFELEKAKKEEADKERVKNAIRNVISNADRDIRNYAFDKNREYVSEAGKLISDAFRAFAKNKGLPEKAPSITAKKGTEEYQNQTITRDRWFNKQSEVSKEFDTKIRPLIQSTFLDKAIIDKNTAKDALMKRLLEQNVPIENAKTVADVLSNNYTDYSVLNKDARKEHRESAKMYTDLMKSLGGTIAKPGSKTGSKDSLIGGKNSLSVIKTLEGEGIEFQDMFGDIKDTPPEPILVAVQDLMDRDYDINQAKSIVIEAARLSRNDRGNVDIDNFIPLVEDLANKTPKKRAANSFERYNKPLLESMNKFANSAVSHLNAAMSTGLHNRVLDSKLDALRRFVDKQSAITPTIKKPTVTVNKITSPDDKRSNNLQSTLSNKLSSNNTPVNDGTVKSLALNILQNPEIEKDLRNHVQLRIAAINEKDPTKAIELHNRVQQSLNKLNQRSDKLKDINNVPVEQLTSILDKTDKYRSENAGPMQVPYGQMQQQINIANEAIKDTQQELSEAKQAYDTTGLPQFKTQIEKLIEKLKDLQNHKQLWSGLLKSSNTSFLNSISGR